MEGLLSFPSIEKNGWALVSAEERAAAASATSSSRPERCESLCRTSGMINAVVGSMSDSASRYAPPLLTCAAGSTCRPCIWYMPAFPASFQRRGRRRRHWLQSAALARRRSCRRLMEARLLRSAASVKRVFALSSPLKFSVFIHTTYYIPAVSNGRQ
jgi:hypothetical protein